jgi:anaerobic ribonucleoside-triphosphate reductase activating protein
MKMLLSRMHYPVTALGPGRRLGIWLQGCHIACPGCVSRDTWPAEHHFGVELATVLGWCATHDPAAIDGVTITGGEPSEQPEALAALVCALNEYGRAHDWDLLCYTGVEVDEFASRCPSAFAQIDALITGPYRADLPTNLIWRGSANQQLLPLTPRGHERYDQWISAAVERPMIQVHVDESDIWMIGIPRRGDLPRLERSLASRGIRLERASWRP